MPNRPKSPRLIFNFGLVPSTMEMEDTFPRVRVNLMESLSRKFQPKLVKCKAFGDA